MHGRSQGSWCGSGGKGMEVLPTSLEVTKIIATCFPQPQKGSPTHPPPHTCLLWAMHTRVQKRKPTDGTGGVLAPCWIGFHKEYRKEPVVSPFETPHPAPRPPQLISDIHLLLSQASQPPLRQQRFKTSGAWTPYPLKGNLLPLENQSLT